MQGTLRVVRIGFVLGVLFLFRFAFGVFFRIVPCALHGRGNEARC